MDDFSYQCLRYHELTVMGHSKNRTLTFFFIMNILNFQQILQKLEFKLNKQAVSFERISVSEIVAGTLILR